MPTGDRLGHHYGSILANENSRLILGDVNINSTILIDDEQDSDAELQKKLYRRLANFDLNRRRNQLLATKTRNLDLLWEGGNYGARVVEWLGSMDPIFWLSGKPASGKSTFMRYLSEHPSTGVILEQATNVSWRVIRFYFDFRAHNTIANSIEGLLRAILAQLVAASRRIARFTSDSEFAQFFSHESHSIGQDLLQETIISAIVTTKLYVCMFIDGLDEFEGSYHELARLIKDLSNVRGIKIFVASRPEQAFQLAFQGVPSIRMQDFNSEPIKAYTEECLSRFAYYLQPRHALTELIQSVLSDSRGVFLWVHLVCSDLVEGLLACETASELQARVSHYPRDLDTVYDRLLNRLDPRILPEAALILRLVDTHRLPELEIDRLWITLRWLASRGVLASFPQQSISAGDFDTRVRSRVGGLVDIIDVGVGTHIRLIHKTLASYLHNSEFLTSKLPQYFTHAYPQHVWARLMCDIVVNNTTFSALSTEDFGNLSLERLEMSDDAWSDSTRKRLALSEEEFVLQRDEVLMAVGDIVSALLPNGPVRWIQHVELRTFSRDAIKTQAFCWAMIQLGYFDYSRTLRSQKDRLNFVRLSATQRGLLLCLSWSNSPMAAVFLQETDPATKFARVWCCHLDGLPSAFDEYNFSDQNVVPGFMEWLAQAPPLEDEPGVASNPWWNRCPCFYRRSLRTPRHTTSKCWMLSDLAKMTE